MGVPIKKLSEDETIFFTAKQQTKKGQSLLIFFFSFVFISFHFFSFLFISFHFFCFDYVRGSAVSEPPPDATEGEEEGEGRNFFESTARISLW